MRGKKPIPFQLAMWYESSEMLYKCPKCGCDLRILGDLENHCHGCGVKLDWSDSPRDCSDEFRVKYEEDNANINSLLFQFYKGLFR